MRVVGEEVEITTVLFNFVVAKRSKHFKREDLRVRFCFVFVGNKSVGRKIFLNAMERIINRPIERNGNKKYLEELISEGEKRL